MYPQSAHTESAAMVEIQSPFPNYVVVVSSLRACYPEEVSKPHLN